MKNKGSIPKNICFFQKGGRVLPNPKFPLVKKVRYFSKRGIFAQSKISCDFLPKYEIFAKRFIWIFCQNGEGGLAQSKNSLAEKSGSSKLRLGGGEGGPRILEIQICLECFPKIEIYY